MLLPFAVGATPLVVESDVHRHTPRVIAEVVVAVAAQCSLRTLRHPGEARHPLRQIASGGELSRIMLGIKAMFARKEEADTLIFDEIDTGISGRTAQKVAEKLVLVSSERQVLCITHLPQIAAMEDVHFLIEKSVSSGSGETAHTATHIRRLSKEESIDELARMTGGAELTQSTRQNAEEMKRQAAESKQREKNPV